MEKVSVIVPVYNAEKTIHRCVESLLAQTYGNIEIILVNDGSTDGSFEICSRYQRKHGHIYAFDRENQGVSAARNFGLGASGGKYIQFVDSDDYVEDSICEKLVGALEGSGADMAICPIKRKRAGKATVWKLQAGVYEKEEAARKLMEIYKASYVNSPVNKLYRKELIREGFPIELSLGEDLLFNLAYLRQCKRVAFLSEALYVYDMGANQGSLSKEYRKDKFGVVTMLYHAVCRYGLENGLGEEELRPAREAYITDVFYGMQDLICNSGLGWGGNEKVLEEWLQNGSLQQCVHHSYRAGLQQQAACLLIKTKNAKAMAAFFYLRGFLLQAGRLLEALRRKIGKEALDQPGRKQDGRRFSYDHHPRL